MIRWWVAPVTALALMNGCSGGPQRGEVEGMVTLDGKPLPGVQVVFVPAGGESAGARSVGYTDEGGRYRLQGDRGEVGAVIGTHSVAVTDPRSLRMPGGVKDAKKSRPAASRVPGRYTAFSTTPLRADVRAGVQTVDLELTGSAK